MVSGCEGDDGPLIADEGESMLGYFGRRLFGALDEDFGVGDEASSEGGEV